MPDTIPFVLRIALHQRETQDADLSGCSADCSDKVAAYFTPVNMFCCVLFCYTVSSCECIFLVCVLCCLKFINMFHIQMHLMQGLDRWNEYIYICMYVALCFTDKEMFFLHHRKRNRVASSLQETKGVCLYEILV